MKLAIVFLLVLVIGLAFATEERQGFFAEIPTRTQIVSLKRELQRLFRANANTSPFIPLAVRLCKYGKNKIIMHQIVWKMSV